MGRSDPASNTPDPEPAVESVGVLSANAATYAAMTAAQRGDAVQQLAALCSAVHAELLDVIAAAEASCDWVPDGATAMAPWLVATCGVATPTAREWSRAATALQSLPALRAAYGAGEMSWDQVRPATRFVTPDTDADAARDLPSRSAAAIAFMARQHRPIADTDAAEAHANRSVSWRADHRRGGYQYSGFLPFDQGAAFNAAIDRHAETTGPDPALGGWDTIAHRRADALHDLATRALGADPDPDRATVVVHADAMVIDGQARGNGRIADVAICQTTVLRSLCDARVEVALHDTEGVTVGIARASQQIPPWLRRHIGGRDHTCRFPGCERHIRQIHHIAHWVRGGTTNATNLIGLCWTHHHLVHEGNWTIHGNPDHEVTFTSPHRRQLRSRPHPLRPDVRHQVRHTTGAPLDDPPDHPPNTSDPPDTSAGPADS